LEENLAEEVYAATGRRKEAVAQVRLRNGSGKIIINGKNASDYLCRANIVTQALKPIDVSELGGKLDVECVATGGGLSGQAGAVCLALARALVLMDPELRPLLKRNGLLTRDSRMVERKKYGLVKARKRYQFSKR
jgi:small subunit ribosomal protein S9